MADTACLRHTRHGRRRASLQRASSTAGAGGCEAGRVLGALAALLVVLLAAGQGPVARAAHIPRPPTTATAADSNPASGPLLALHPPPPPAPPAPPLSAAATPAPQPAAAATLSLAVQGETITVGDDTLSLEFADASGDFNLLSVVQQGTSKPSPSLISASKTHFWQAQMVVSGKAAPVSIDGHTSCAQKTFLKASDANVLFFWNKVEVEGGNASTALANVVVNVSVADGQASISLNFANPNQAAFGLWTYTVNLGLVTIFESPTAAMVKNRGFGTLEQCAATGCQAFSAAYPQSTFQFLAVYDAASRKNGVYFATHDPSGASKTFVLQRPDSHSGMLQVQVVPPNAGQTLSAQVEPTFPIVITAFDGDWWDASQIYRSWVLNSAASWVSKGPIVQRPDVPHWLLNLTTWVNSHWQGNDIFNTSGGDPAVVLERMTAITARFGLPNLGLHWYEWDTLGYREGSNYSTCTSEVTCGFDTHYPEYFPVRTGFGDVVQQLQALGVRVAPYINGRIFDVGTSKWTQDHAQAHACKNSPSVFHPNTSSLTLYNEQYGSKAVFAVMCPHTPYWQDIFTDVISTLKSNYSVDGVYIDQIAAAGPRPCFDPTHNHSIGGGNHWVTGYRKLLTGARQSAGDSSVILTESNAEPFMDGVNVFLTLVGFSGDFAGSNRIVNVFGAVYGGFYISMGAEFFQQDFDDPNVFSAKIAQQLMFGAQLGWFSLGGRNNQNPPMGIIDQLLDPAHDPEIAYLKTLAAVRLQAADFVVHGRAMRDLPLKVNGTSMTARHHPSVVRQSRDPAAPVGLSYNPVACSTWLSADISTLGILISPVERNATVHVSFEISMLDFGFADAASTAQFDVIEIAPNKKQTVLGTYAVGSVAYNATLTGHQVVYLVVHPTPNSDY